MNGALARFPLLRSLFAAFNTRQQKTACEYCVNMVAACLPFCQIFRIENHVFIKEIHNMHKYRKSQSYFVSDGRHEAAEKYLNEQNNRPLKDFSRGFTLFAVYLQRASETFINTPQPRQ